MTTPASALAGQTDIMRAFVSSVLNLAMAVEETPIVSNLASVCETFPSGVDKGCQASPETASLEKIVEMNLRSRLDWRCSVHNGGLALHMWPNVHEEWITHILQRLLSVRIRR